jgi:metallo-beta-lactamase family protein
LHVLYELKHRKKIPDLPTYLDSPMAINATDLYCRYHDEHRLNRKACEDMFNVAIITRTPEESRAINDVVGPKIIISASGMASGGRVVHHLAQYISDKKNVVILVGFQAAGTRGRALLEGAAEIKMFGKYFPVKARIEYISGLSAHADGPELIRWLENSPIKHPKVFVTHGEQASAESFAEKLEDSFQWQVTVPKDGEEFGL